MSAETETEDGRPWDDINFVTRSQYRSRVLTDLTTNGPATPSELSDATGDSMPSVSHALSELRDRGFVQLLVDESLRKGRIYGATDAGRSLAGHIEEVQR